MESILFEKPLLIGVLGIIAAAVLAFVWLQTMQPRLLYALVLVLSVTVVGILVAWWVTTEKEQVDQVLHEAAAAVQRNDLDAVLALIHSSTGSIRDQVRAEFPNYEFHEIKIKSNLEISFDDPRHPTEAVARFNVLVAGSERQGLIRNFRVPRFCSVTFRKDGDAWRLFAYQHSDAREGLLRR